MAQQYGPTCNAIVTFQKGLCSSCGTHFDDNPAASEIISKVRELIDRGKKIEAIRIYHELTGVGLREARDAVLAIEKNAPVLVPKPTVNNAPIADVGVNRNTTEKIKQLLLSGKKLEAIKVYHQACKTDLKESKKRVEVIETELKSQALPQSIRADAGRQNSLYASAEPVMSPNPFDESKKVTWIKWVFTAMILIILCLSMASLIYIFAGGQIGGL